MTTVPPELENHANATPAIVAAYHLGSDETIHELSGSLDLDTRFPIASVTKTLTALLAARLCVDNLVDWDRPVGSGADLQSSPTLRQLLTHTAAVPFELLPSHWMAAPLTAPELQSAFEHTPRMPFPPETWHYSNLGYALAAHELERATGKAYTELLATHVLGPLGLEHTSFPVESEGTGVLGAAGPAGDIWSTLEDLMTLAYALSGSNPDVITFEMLALMLKCTAVDSSGSLLGAGLRIHQHGQHRLLVSSGTISHHATVVAAWPRRGASVLVAETGYSHNLLQELAVLQWRREDVKACTWWWDGHEVTELRHADHADLIIRESRWPFPLFTGRVIGSTYVGVDWRDEPLELRHQGSSLVGPGIVLTADVMDSAYTTDDPW